MDQLKSGNKVQLKCKQHPFQIVSYVCTSEKCKEKLLCSYCMKEDKHKQHNIHTYLLKELIDERQVDYLLSNIFGIEYNNMEELMNRFEQLIKSITDKLSDVKKIIFNKIDEQNSAYTNLKKLISESQQNLVRQLNQKKSYEEISSDINNFLGLKDSVNHQVKIDIQALNQIQIDLIKKCGEIENILSNQQNLITKELKFQNSFLNKYQNFIQQQVDSTLLLRMDTGLLKAEQQLSQKQTQKIFLNHLFDPNKNYKIVINIGFKNVNKFQKRIQQINNELNNNNNIINNNLQQNQNNGFFIMNANNSYDQNNSNQNQGIFADQAIQNNLAFGSLFSNNYRNKNNPQPQTSGLFGGNTNNQQSQQFYGQIASIPSTGGMLFSQPRDKKVQPPLQQKLQANQQSQQQQMQIEQVENNYQQPEIQYYEELPFILKEDISEENCIFNQQQQQQQDIKEQLKQYFTFQGLKLIFADSNKNPIKGFNLINNKFPKSNSFGQDLSFSVKSKDLIEIYLNKNKLEILISNSRQTEQELLLQDISTYSIGFNLYYQKNENIKQGNNVQIEALLTEPILTIKEIQQII